MNYSATRKKYQLIGAMVYSPIIDADDTVIADEGEIIDLELANRIVMFGLYEIALCKTIHIDPYDELDDSEVKQELDRQAGDAWFDTMRDMEIENG